MKPALVAVAALVFLSGCTAPRPAVSSAVSVVELAGERSLVSETMVLTGGSYRLDWTAAAPPFPQTLRVTLRATEGRYSHEFVSTLVERETTDRTWVHQVPAGRYYLDVRAEMRWSLTLRAN